MGASVLLRAKSLITKMLCLFFNCTGSNSDFWLDHLNLVAPFQFSATVQTFFSCHPQSFTSVAWEYFRGKRKASPVGLSRDKGPVSLILKFFLPSDSLGPEVCLSSFPCWNLRQGCWSGFCYCMTPSITVSPTAGYISAWCFLMQPGHQLKKLIKLGTPATMTPYSALRLKVLGSSVTPREVHPSARIRPKRLWCLLHLGFYLRPTAWWVVTMFLSRVLLPNVTR